ncbi:MULTISPECIES: GNAT family N-acetyltransferase [Halorussus]|uniref:GNAT family N-acetyltransferase n=1 Tax=Halorussus TaxID=1070314 RepID=UPI000E21A66E|nr:MULTISPECIES: GNAT family N-acetyltransferase [Halorussus]NHN59951.1 GNAT family N-acetyltransferase [Halorussus sp. JP-T4]
MDIRDATDDDVPAIRSVARESWSEAYADVVPESVIDDAVSEWYAEETMNRFIGDDEQVCLVAADEDGAVVGFAHGATEGGERSEATRTSEGERTESSGTEGDVLRLSVSPDRWGEGIGSTLLEAVEDRLTAMGAERIRAMVLADNEMGNAFYEDRGFEKAGEAETQLDGTTRTENVYAKAY